MSYMTSDLTFPHYTAPFLRDPIRRPNALVISLIAGLLTVGPGIGFIVHQIGQLPRVDPNETPHLVATYDAPQGPVTKLEVMSTDDNAPIINAAYAYAPTVTAQQLSAEIGSDDAWDLIATLEEHPNADTVNPSAADAVATAQTVSGPGQVIEVATAEQQPSPDEVFPAYSPEGRLVAVPDEELQTP